MNQVAKSLVRVDVDRSRRLSVQAVDHAGEKRYRHSGINRRNIVGQCADSAARRLHRKRPFRAARRHAAINVVPNGENRLISFIVPAYDEEILLGATLDALHAAGSSLKEPYELVVADDASTDRTASIAERHEARVVRVAHRQIAATRNSGARAAMGELTAPCAERTRS